MSDKLVAYFGSGARCKDDAWISPKFYVSLFKSDSIADEKSYNNVAEAFDCVSGSMANINKHINEVA